ncbi:MAG: hypothetical protein RLZZ450_6710 [Pseudomonadota bacterium]|jgi:hypothetical protein
MRARCFSPLVQRTSWPRRTNARAMGSMGVTCPVDATVAIIKRAILVMYRDVARALLLSSPHARQLNEP